MSLTRFWTCLFLGCCWALPVLAMAQVAQYNLDQQVTDSAGASHGTAVGTPTYGVGKKSYALTVNGTTQYVTLGTPAGLDLPGAVTISAWINPALVAGSNRCIVGDMTSGGSVGQYILLLLATGELTMGWGDTVSYALFTSSAPVATLSTWQHVAATRDGSGNVVLYYNGAAIAGGFTDGDTSTPIAADPLGASLGRAGAYDGEYFNGSLDDVRLYDTALTAAQVLALTRLGATRRQMRY